MESANRPKTKAELLLIVEKLIQENAEYRKENAEYRRENDSLKNDNRNLRNNNYFLEEILKARERMLFGRKSEKLTDDEMQDWLFDEPEFVVEKKSTQREETIEIPAHARKKRGRKAIPDNLPRREIIHDISEEEKKCSCCGRSRPRIGEDVSEELEYKPAELIVNKHVYVKYGPCSCKNETSSPVIMRAPQVSRLVPGGMAGPGLLAHLATCKYADGLPFYRMERIFKRLGIDYSRQTMCNQMIAVSRACQDVIDLMWKEVRAGPLLQLDETTVQVLHEPERSASQKSYMWVTVGYHKETKVVLFHYHPSRSGEVAKTLTDGYRGYIQTDGYAAYTAVGEREGIIHIGCWAHARRKFFEAKADILIPGLSDRALALIAKIFAIDNKCLEAKKDLVDSEFIERRRKQTKPVLDELKTLVDSNIATVPEQSNLGKALAYLSCQWPKLIRYLEQPFLRPDNNQAENAIRPFVIGRKNWLFSNTPLGAHASAAIYSLVETARANKLEPYSYLKYLFTLIPKTPHEQLSMLLPNRIDPLVLDRTVEN